ncbi:MAG TPA: reverse transcriptase family protein, partial [Methylomicrobium sp.]|nr:reverse transcriptase family protein [Methylomicrobium sp.]
THRPPRTNINRFLDELSDIVDEAGSLGMHLVILGDFNCPGDAPTDFDSQLEAWLSCYDMSVSSYGPSHLNYLNFDGGLSRLDLIAESGHPRKLSDASTVLTGFSDHRLLTAALDCTRPPAAAVTYCYRDIRHLDVSTFRNLFRASSSVVSPSDDPNVIAQQLDDDLTAVLDRLAPLRTRTRRCAKPATRWISDAVVNAKKARRRLERKYSRTRCASDRKAYRAACRSTHKLITESRSNFIRDEVNSVAGSPKLLWRSVNRLLHPAAAGNWYDGMDTTDLASGFSNFFADKVNRVKAAVSAGLRSMSSPITSCPPPSPPHSIFSSFSPVSALEVERLIHAAPSKTSPLDPLPITLFKQCSAELSVVIAHLANRSFMTGTFPTMMKAGLVTPLLKKPGLDVSEQKNFRPITNLTTVSKILERLALARLRPHLTASPNFCSLQSAYRSAHSTETALVKVVDDMLSAIDSGSIVALVGLDISAAFDTVNHSILLDRLQREFGIADQSLRWFASYLSGRSVRVRVGKSTSASVYVDSGVPQGSVLGPILFITYISPVGRLIASHGIGFHKYADDTQLYISLQQPITPSLDTLAQCTTDLQHWYWSNDLLLNPDKSEVAFFGTRQRMQRVNLPASVTVAGSSVAVCDTLKTLGIKLDRTLSFDSHVNDIVRSCNYHLQALRHLCRSLTRDTANTIACSIVGSRIDYCNALLYGMSKKNFDKLQRVQNNMARVVCDVGRRDVHSDVLLHSLHWLPVRRRVDFKVATLCWKVCYLGQPPYLFDLIHPYTPSRSLRSSDTHLLQDRRSRTVTADRRFSVAAPRLWNCLPVNIRNCSSIGTFQMQLKTYLYTCPID